MSAAIKSGAVVTPIDGYTNGIPDVLVTGGGVDGISPRIRVDVGQTGFFAGREFRTIKELNIASSSTYVVKAFVPINIILFGLVASIESGHLRLSTAAGGTEGGSFAETLPVFGRNNMTDRPVPFYVSQVAISAGGTHSGGTEIDILRIKAEGNTNFAATVGSELGDERGVSPSTYYFILQNLSATDAVTGTFSARWEERP